MRLPVLLLLFLFCSATFAQPDDGSFHLAVRTLLKAQPISAQTVDEPEDDSNNPLVLRSEHLRPVLVRQSEQLLLPDAVVPLTDEEREELWLQMKAAPYDLDYLGLLLPRRAEVFDWVVQQYEGEPSDFPVSEKLKGLRASLAPGRCTAENQYHNPSTKVESCLLRSGRRQPVDWCPR